MVEVVLVRRVVIRHYHPPKLVLRRIAGGLKQRRQERALVKIIAAALKERQFRPFLGAEIMHVANLVMHKIENARRVAAQIRGQRLNVRRVRFRDGGPGLSDGVKSGRNRGCAPPPICWLNEPMLPAWVRPGMEPSWACRVAAIKQKVKVNNFFIGWLSFIAGRW